MRRLAQDFQAGRVLRRHIRAVLVAKREPQGHDVWPRRLARDTTPDVVFPARRRVLVEDQLRRRRRPRALIRRLRRAKVVLADDELRLNGRGGAEESRVCLPLTSAVTVVGRASVPFILLLFKRYRSNSMRLNLPVREVKLSWAPYLS